jgi:putative nucleotidyltransferase with HDIG domain
MDTIPSRGVDPAAFDRLTRELARLSELPSAPRVVQDILRVLGSEQSTAGHLSEVVERDPALAARLLRLANSAYFGLPRPVGQVRAACVVLGFDLVRSLAVGVSALDSLGAGAGRAVDLTAFWRHSVGTAAAAQLLARGLRIPAGGGAFCAGILHDLGKLVLATFAPARYAALAASGGGAEPFRARERRELGGDHEQVGEWLARRWRFPDELCDAVARHHEPWETPGVNRWGALMHLADWIARRNGCPSEPDGDEEVPASPDPRVTEALAASGTLLRDVEGRFRSELARLEAFVDLARG